MRRVFVAALGRHQSGWAAQAAHAIALLICQSYRVNLRQISHSSRKKRFSIPNRNFMKYRMVQIVPLGMVAVGARSLAPPTMRLITNCFAEGTENTCSGWAKTSGG
jgi:hypothetical protein